MPAPPPESEPAIVNARGIMCASSQHHEYHHKQGCADERPVLPAHPIVSQWSAAPAVIIKYPLRLPERYKQRRSDVTITDDPAELLQKEGLSHAIQSQNSSPPFHPLQSA
jgi:hypothetical protein